MVRVLRTRAEEPAMRMRVGGAVLATLLLLSVAGCSSTSSSDKAIAQEKAQQLVAAAKAAGVAPHYTVDATAAEYGTSALQVCGAFKRGLNGPGSLLTIGNPAGRRPKLISTQAVTYGRLVVETYCPNRLKNFNKTVSDLSPTKRTR
jgi:hypothetical protein